MNNPNARAMYPLSAALGLNFVIPAKGAEMAGFDEDDVKAKLGATRFNALMAKVVSSSSVFSCGHRIKNGVEAHAIYANDLEAFLKAGG